MGSKYFRVFTDNNFGTLNTGCLIRGGCLKGGHSNDLFPDPSGAWKKKTLSCNYYTSGTCARTLDLRDKIKLCAAIS